ncbi:TetR/AcrR family transcriptional regulator [Oceanobacillus bengalensis]|uniref:TetR/AcrR family transcriptional regulator n=1 Tax=Oceanobacillus bengalensis TaxID=1435466 RepID=A0A494Z8Z8_9BACI|nr:TetR/AcrR family transcriptional regulator [Oceanobacillus bengalensis]RKQ18539.1 TetR/AcrR family transcriptional regulator [Oceanobacillus bengalensis]
MYILDEISSAREYIIQAFLELLASKTFEMITVKEIVKKAGISRSTFYIHYKDKYELMVHIREHITTEFLSFYTIDRGEKIDPSLSINTITYKICQHIFKYRNFYQHEFDKPEYTQKLSNALAEELTQVYEDQSYAIFASFGTIGYLTFWVRNNFQMSPLEAAEDLGKIGMTDWSVQRKKM